MDFLQPSAYTFQRFPGPGEYGETGEGAFHHATHKLTRAENVWDRKKRDMEKLIPFSTKRIRDAEAEPGPGAADTNKGGIGDKPPPGSRDDMPSAWSASGTRRFIDIKYEVDDTPGPAEAARTSSFSEALRPSRDGNRGPRCKRFMMEDFLRFSGQTSFSGEYRTQDTTDPSTWRKPTRKEKKEERRYQAPAAAPFRAPKPQIKGEMVSPAAYSPFKYGIGSRSKLVHGGGGRYEADGGAKRRSTEQPADAVSREDVDKLVLDRVALKPKRDGSAPKMARDVAATGTFGASRRMNIVEYLVSSGQLAKPGTAPGPGSYGAREYVGHGRLGRTRVEDADLEAVTKQLEKEYRRDFSKTLKAAKANGLEQTREQLAATAPARSSPPPTLPSHFGQRRGSGPSLVELPKMDAQGRMPQLRRASIDAGDGGSPIVTENNYAMVFATIPRDDPLRFMFKHPAPAPSVIPHGAPRPADPNVPSERELLRRQRNIVRDMQRAMSASMGGRPVRSPWGPVKKADVKKQEAAERAARKEMGQRKVDELKRTALSKTAPARQRRKRRARGASSGASARLRATGTRTAARGARRTRDRQVYEEPSVASTNLREASQWSDAGAQGVKVETSVSEEAPRPSASPPPTSPDAEKQ